MPSPINAQPDGSLRTTLLYNIYQQLNSLPTIPITSDINSVTDQLLYDIWQSIISGGGGGGLTNVDVIPITYAQALIDSGAGLLLSGRTYAISGVHNGLCTVYLIATSNSTFAISGTADYQNNYTLTTVNFDVDFDFQNNYFTYVYDPLRNNVFTQSQGNYFGGVSLIEYIDFNALGFNTIDNTFNDCTSLSSVLISLNTSQLLACNLQNVDFVNFNNTAFQFSLMIGGAINCNDSSMYNSTIGNCTLTLINFSNIQNCTIGQNTVISLDGNNITNCTIGNGKTITTDASVSPKNWTGKVIEGSYSTFDTIANPDGLEIIDISDPKFRHIGVIRPDNDFLSNKIGTILTYDDTLNIAVEYNNMAFVLQDGANISHQGGNIDIDNAINKSVFIQMIKTSLTGSKLFVVYHAVQN